MKYDDHIEEMVLVQLFGQATFFIGHQFYLEK
jgi:hypothetical protein